MKSLLSRKYLLVIAMLLIGGILLSGQVLAQVGTTAVVTKNDLNMREEPNPSSTLITQLALNEVVFMQGRNADASYIKVLTEDNLLGWVRGEHLAYTSNPLDLPVLSDTTSSTATPTPQVVQPIAVWGTVNTGALNVRSGPGPQFSRVDTVYFGDNVLLAGRNADSTWVYGTTPDNVNGWLNVQYLTLTAPVTSLPIIGGNVPGVTLTPVIPVPPTATAIPTTTAVPIIPNTAYVTAGSLNVRSGPGVGYTKVTVLGNGEYVFLIGRNLDTTWGLIVNQNSQQGWVNVKYLFSSTNMTGLSVASQTGTGHVVAGNLNLRSGAGPGFSVVTVAPYGSSLVLQGRSSDNSWLLVRANNGKEGWVNGSYVATSLNINQLPVLAGPVPGQPTTPTQPIFPTNPGNTASLRACPNIGCPATGTVYSGLTVTATGRTADNTWIYVVLSNSQQGWIQSQYVALGVPVSSLPVVTTSPTG